MRGFERDGLSNALDQEWFLPPIWGPPVRVEIRPSAPYACLSLFAGGVAPPLGKRNQRSTAGDRKYHLGAVLQHSFRTQSLAGVREESIVAMPSPLVLVWAGPAAPCHSWRESCQWARRSSLWIPRRTLDAVSATPESDRVRDHRFSLRAMFSADNSTFSIASALSIQPKEISWKQCPLATRFTQTKEGASASTEIK